MKPKKTELEELWKGIRRYEEAGIAEQQELRIRIYSSKTTYEEIGYPLNNIKEAINQAEQRGIEKAVGRFTELIGACPDVLPYATKHKMVVRALIAYDRFLFKELEKLKDGQIP